MLLLTKIYGNIFQYILCEILCDSTRYDFVKKSENCYNILYLFLPYVILLFLQFLE